MVMKKTMTNLEILNTATALLESCSTGCDSFPVKVNFFLQKNMTTMIELAKEVEESRIAIIQKYGTPSEDGSDQYTVPTDMISIANSELQDLFALTQEVSINMLSLDWFDNIDLSAAQVKAISFMISEE